MLNSPQWVFLPQIYLSPLINVTHCQAKLVTFLKARFLPLILLPTQALTQTIHHIPLQWANSWIQGQRKPRWCPTFVWSPSSLPQLEATAIYYESQISGSRSTLIFWSFPKLSLQSAFLSRKNRRSMGKSSIAFWSGSQYRWISISSLISVSNRKLGLLFLHHEPSKLYYTTQDFSGVSGFGNPLAMNFPFWWQLASLWISVIVKNTGSL